MTSSERHFIDLLQISVGSRKSLDGPIPDAEWGDIYAMACKQSVVGVVTSVLDVLPDDVKAPLAVYSKFALATEKIEARNELSRERARELSSLFSGAGFRTCILKGQAFSLYYPQPLRRQCGDIDIWVEGPLKKVLRFVRSNCEVGEVVYHHCDSHFFKDIPVEVHFTPSWMNGFIANFRLQRWFSERADRQFGNVEPSLGVAVTDREFSAAFCVMHTFRHVVDEGVGLRQLMDCFYILKSLSSGERSNVQRLMSDLHLETFCGALMYSLSFFFKLPKACFLFDSDPDLGEFLCREVMISGNLGIRDSRNAHSAHECRPHKLYRKTRRQLRFFSLAPLEISSTPLFKGWQYVWRRINRYF